MQRKNDVKQNLWLSPEQIVLFDFGCLLYGTGFTPGALKKHGTIDG
jgi:hypothetical protein